MTEINFFGWTNTLTLLQFETAVMAAESPLFSPPVLRVSRQHHRAPSCGRSSHGILQPRGATGASAGPGRSAALLPTGTPDVTEFTDTTETQLRPWELGRLSLSLSLTSHRGFSSRFWFWFCTEEGSETHWRWFYSRRIMKGSDELHSSLLLSSSIGYP